MRKLFLIIAIFFFSGSLLGQTVYTYAVTTIEGVSKPLSNYQGKKILVFTLPLVQSSASDSLLHALDSIGVAYADSLVIIAAPSYEDGYLPANKNALKQWYRSILSPVILVTDGLYSRKISGSQQHPLFQWLTDKNKNGHYDIDVTGPRDKFFVWKDGELVGVLGVSTRLHSTAMNELLEAQ